MSEKPSPKKLAIINEKYESVEDLSNQLEDLL